MSAVQIMRLTAMLAAALAAPSVPSTAQAQDIRPLRGVVFDSLRMTPLAGATVHIAAHGAMTTTDDRGRFRFDSITTGAVTLAVEHPLLDSIGLFTLRARATHDGRTEHRVSVPAFATFTSVLCGRAVSGDSAVLYGAVTDAEGKPARAAAIAVAWLAVQRTREGKVGQQRMTYATSTDTLGRFAACGLPADEPYTVEARGAGADSALRVTLSLPAQAGRVLRQEVMLPAIAAITALSDRATVVSDTMRAVSASIDSTRIPTGVVRGTVRGPNGEPIANARISGDGVAEAVSDSVGRFLMPRVPTGSRQLDVVALGRTPQMRLVQMRVRDTLDVAFVLDRVTTLAGVKTEATVLGELVRSYEERRRIGLGRYRDSTELARMPSMASAFDGVPNLIVSRAAGGFGLKLKTPVQIRTGSDKCEPRIFIDGRADDMFSLNRLQPRDIAWVEVYTRSSVIPVEFMEGVQNRACGVVAVMTKRRLGR